MTSYSQKSLTDNETIIKQAEISLWSQIIWLIILFLVCFTFLTNWLGTGTMNPFAAGIIIIVSLKVIINIKSTELAVTNKKVVAKTGFIKRTSFELVLKKVEAMSVDQSVLGRIFGFGTICISGTGGNVVNIPFIKSPVRFKQEVSSLLA